VWARRTSDSCVTLFQNDVIRRGRLSVVGRPRTNDEAVKERLVVCATEMLATRPRESVTVRAVAAAAETSTTAVYSLFGGKDGLIGAVRDRAVAGLFQDVSAVPTSETIHWPIFTRWPSPTAVGDEATVTCTRCCSVVCSLSTRRGRSASTTRSARSSRRSTAP
jgi:AcrR family transcriptional regulator